MFQSAAAVNLDRQIDLNVRKQIISGCSFLLSLIYTNPMLGNIFNLSTAAPADDSSNFATKTIKALRSINPQASTLPQFTSSHKRSRSVDKLGANCDVQLHQFPSSAVARDEAASVIFPCNDAHAKCDSKHQPRDDVCYAPSQSLDWIVNFFDGRLAVEAIPSMVCSIIGLLLAGGLLDDMQHWPIFNRISELVILIPILLNLKGNLEMNLAARVSTAANLGRLDDNDSCKKTLMGNLIIIQIQGIVVGAVSGLLSVVLNSAFNQTWTSLYDTLFTVSCSVFTAALSSLILGVFMCAVIVMSRRMNINPDNISTPLAATLGDIVTLGVMAIATIFLERMNQHEIIVSILGMLATLPLLVRYARANRLSNTLLYDGWTPLLLSMVIASISGIMLEQSFHTFTALALLAPIVNGIAGNLGGIYTSRITTSLHGGFSEKHAETIWTLCVIHAPIQLITIGVIYAFAMGEMSASLIFTALYLILCTILLLITLWMAKAMCEYTWKLNLDPDSYVLPYLTAFSDVIGTAFLIFLFQSV